MTEEITSRLATVRGLRVISRTSAMQYKETRPSLKQVGEELGVDYVLEGTVRWARTEDGSRVRITPQLIQIADDTHLWANSYDRVIEDVFEIQSEIASQVVDQLGISLGGSEQDEIEARPTDSLEAYQAYLRGLDLGPATTLNTDDWELAVQLFERAIELDPEFVSAYCWLARTQLFIHFVKPSHERVSRGKAAADRALALAPDHPEAHLAMGYYYYRGLRDFESALTFFDTARAQRRNDPEVISAIAAIHRRQGRWDEALEGLQAAFKLDPLRAKRAVIMGDTLSILRRFEEAQQFLERAITIAPEEPHGYTQLAWVFQGTGHLTQARAVLEAMPRQDSAEAIRNWIEQELYERNYQAALERLTTYPESSSNFPSRALWEGQIYRLLGDPARSRDAYEIALHQLEEELEQEQESLDLPWLYSALGTSLAGLGRNEEALRAATRASDLLPISRDAIEGATLAASVAGIHCLAGDYETALNQLDHLLSIPASITVWELRLHPAWDPLRDHPRFQALLEKYGQEG